MNHPAIDELFKLSKNERMQIAIALWNSVELEDEDLGLTEEQLAEIDRRVKHLDEHPEDTIPWEEVKARILKRLRSRT